MLPRDWRATPGVSEGSAGIKSPFSALKAWPLLPLCCSLKWPSLLSLWLNPIKSQAGQQPPLPPPPPPHSGWTLSARHPWMIANRSWMWSRGRGQLALQGLIRTGFSPCPPSASRKCVHNIFPRVISGLLWRPASPLLSSTSPRLSPHRLALIKSQSGGMKRELTLPEVLKE